MYSHRARRPPKRPHWPRLYGSIRRAHRPHIGPVGRVYGIVHVDHIGREQYVFTEGTSAAKTATLAASICLYMASISAAHRPRQPHLWACTRRPHRPGIVRIHRGYVGRHNGHIGRVYMPIYSEHIGRTSAPSTASMGLYTSSTSAGNSMYSQRARRPHLQAYTAYQRLWHCMYQSINQSINVTYLLTIHGDCVEGGDDLCIRTLHNAHRPRFRV